jgi:hypothetical protein
VQELCNVRVQVDFSLGSTGLRVLDNPRTILIDLLLNLDGTSAIHEVASLKDECFEDSHACGDWRLILLTRRLDPNIPALTDPAIGTTFFEEALVAGASGRMSELMAVWNMG